QSFVTLAAFEYAAPPVDAAVKRIKRLREFAKEPLCLLDSKMLSSRRGSSALYADELIAWHLYQVVLKPSQEHKYLAPFAEGIRLFEKACAWALVPNRPYLEPRLLEDWRSLEQLDSSGHGDCS